MNEAIRYTGVEIIGEELRSYIGCDEADYLRKFCYTGRWKGSAPPGCLEQNLRPPVRHGRIRELYCPARFKVTFFVSSPFTSITFL